MSRRPTQTPLRETDGYSLVEITTASVAAGLLVLVALSAFLTADRALTAWKHDRALDADALTVASALARDIEQHSGEIDLTIGGAVFEGERPVTYAVRDSALFRNEVAMLAPGTRLVVFDVSESGEEQETVVVRFVLAADGRTADRRTAERRVVRTRRIRTPWPAPPDA